MSSVKGSVRKTFTSCVIAAAAFGAGATTAGAASTKGADKKISAAGLLTLDDFPSGWKSTSPPKSTTFDEAAKTIAGCKTLLAAKATAKSRGAHSESRSFEKSRETYSNVVTVMPDESAAAKLYDGYSAAKTQNCVAEVAGMTVKAKIIASSSSAADGAKVTTSVGEVSGAEVGTESARYQLVVKISGPKIPFSEEAYFDFVYVLNGRSLTIYQHTNSYERSETMLDQLIDTTQRRLTAALAGQPVPAANEPVALGSAQSTSDGAVITVYSVTPNVPGKYSGDGPYTIADVQICAAKGASSKVDASTYGFQLLFADNTSVKATYGGPDPRFNSSTLTDGACARGNVPFEPTQTSPPTKVLYDSGFSDGKPLAWKTS